MKVFSPPKMWEGKKKREMTFNSYCKNQIGLYQNERWNMHTVRNNTQHIKWQQMLHHVYVLLVSNPIVCRKILPTIMTVQKTNKHHCNGKNIQYSIAEILIYCTKCAAIYLNCATIFLRSECKIIKKPRIMKKCKILFPPHKFCLCKMSCLAMKIF